MAAQRLRRRPRAAVPSRGSSSRLPPVTARCHAGSPSHRGSRAMRKYNYDRLSAQDNTFLLFEKPGLYMHVSATQIFELGPLRNELGGVDFERIRGVHRVGAAPHPALSAEAGVDSDRAAAGVDRRRRLRPQLPRSPHRAAAARLRGAAEEARGPRDGAAPRPRAAALGAVGDRGPRAATASRSSARCTTA